MGLRPVVVTLEVGPYVFDGAVGVVRLFGHHRVDGRAVMGDLVYSDRVELDEGAARVLSATSLARSMEPDVEALLVRRPRAGALASERGDVLLVPVDVGYELVGIVRRRWRGLDGGDDAREAIDAFFARLATRARRLTPERR